MGIIRAAHINQLADFTEGRDRIGELIRRLIWNWLPNRIVGMSFLSGETNNYPGWDGWVRLNLGNGLPHNSLWELSVRKDAAEKIRSDFVKAASRSLPSGWSRNSTTYVAVTARSLADKDELTQELRLLNSHNWADIQIIDAKSLENWIEMCPSVEQWMAETFAIAGMPATTSLALYWSRWSEVTQPSISPALMIAGRDISEVKTNLESNESRLISLQADSPEEAIGVLFATLQQLPETQRDKFLFNATVLASEEAACRTAEQPRREEAENLTILLPPATTHAATLVKRGHKVCLALGRNNPSFSQISLRRALRSDFEESLISSMNISAAEAATDAKACGSSVSIWRVWHLLRNGSLDQLPIWARSTTNRLVVPAVFARAWDDKIELDKEIISILASSQYADYRDQIHDYSTCNDPLYEQAGSVHKVIAPSVAYALVRDSITPTHISNLEKAFHRVFSSLDAHVVDVWDTLEIGIPTTEKQSFSDWIKDGLAETLLAIAFLPQPNSGILNSYGGGQQFADLLIRKLPGLSNDPRVLASFSNQLPLLAEAAPIPFVEALEKLLQGAHNLEPLFRDRGFFSQQFHVGLLWSLEVLAWSPDFLPRITAILLELSKSANTERSGNSPQNSLREIYLAWINNTSVSGEVRANILRELSGKYPTEIWKLLIQLLPKDHDTSSGAHQPMWRDFDRSSLASLTRREIARCYRAYAEIALTLAEQSFEKQIDLLEFFAEFPDEYRERILAMLESNQENNNIDPQQWNKLRDFVSKNLSFSNAKWAVDKINLQRIDAISKRLAPQKPSERARWLFDDAWPEIGDNPYNHKERAEQLTHLRLSAAEEILHKEGAQKLDELIEKIQYPQFLAEAVARLPKTNEWLLEHMNNWAINHNRNQLIAIQSASSIRYRLKGEEWTSALLDKASVMTWPSLSVAHALLDFPLSISLFQKIDNLGNEVAQYYWKNCWLHADSLDQEAKLFASKKLLEHNRPAYLLSIVDRHFSDFGIDVVVSALEGTINSLLKANEQANHHLAHDIEEAIRWLRNQSTIDRITLAKFEYPLIPILTANVYAANDSPLVLHEILSEEPSFFIQVLSDVFRKRSEAKLNNDSSSDESARARARAGWRLLKSWKLVPGTQANGKINSKALMDWMKKSTELAKQEDREEVALLKIGEVLYHAKPDPESNAWPPLEVLDLLETMASEQIERGFALECVNSKGVTSRNPMDGGTLERELQRQWEERAVNTSSRYTRVRALFLRIAQDWGSQATWHDERAAQDRMRWS